LFQIDGLRGAFGLQALAFADGGVGCAGSFLEVGGGGEGVGQF